MTAGLFNLGFSCRKSLSLTSNHDFLLDSDNSFSIDNVGLSHICPGFAHFKQWERAWRCSQRLFCHHFSSPAWPSHAHTQEPSEKWSWKKKVCAQIVKKCLCIVSSLKFLSEESHGSEYLLFLWHLEESVSLSSSCSYGPSCPIVCALKDSPEQFTKLQSCLRSRSVHPFVPEPGKWTVV